MQNSQPRQGLTPRKRTRNAPPLSVVEGSTNAWAKSSVSLKLGPQRIVFGQFFLADTSSQVLGEKSQRALFGQLGALFMVTGTMIAVETMVCRVDINLGLWLGRFNLVNV